MNVFKKIERINAKLKVLEAIMGDGNLTIEEWEIYLDEYSLAWEMLYELQANPLLRQA